MTTETPPAAGEATTVAAPSERGTAPPSGAGGARAARGRGGRGVGRDGPVLGGRRSVGRDDRQRVRHLDPAGGARVDFAADAGECDARLRRGRDDPPAGRERAGRDDTGAADGDDRSGDALSRAGRRCTATPRRSSEAGATLAADQQQESVDCAGNNAAQAPSAGSGAAAGGASGGCCHRRAVGCERTAVRCGGCGEGRGRSEPGQFCGARRSRPRARRSRRRARRRPRTARTRRSRVFPRLARSCGADSRCSRSTARLCCCSTVRRLQRARSRPECRRARTWRS